jgi:hypothetical protein
MAVIFILAAMGTWNLTTNLNQDSREPSSDSNFVPPVYTYITYSNIDLLTSIINCLLYVLISKNSYEMELVSVISCTKLLSTMYYVMQFCKLKINFTQIERSEFQTNSHIDSFVQVKCQHITCIYMYICGWMRRRWGGGPGGRERDWNAIRYCSCQIHRFRF